MAYKRNIQEISKIEEQVRSGQKIYVRYAEGARLYSMGTHGFMDLAKEAGAVRKIKGVCLVNLNVLERYVEDVYGQ